MAPKAVIFDLDGTLIDSLADIADAGNRMLARRGAAPLPMDRYPAFIGRGARQLVEGLLAGTDNVVTEAVVRAALRDFRDEYSAALLVKTAPYPRVEQLLGALQERGIPMAILSNKPDDWTRTIISGLLPNTAFVDVRGQRQGVPRKPDPSAAVELASVLKAATPEIAFIGDTTVDVRTAQAAGMRSVGVTWGFTPREELAAAEPDHLVDRMADLHAVLLDTPGVDR